MDKPAKDRHGVAPAVAAGSSPRGAAAGRLLCDSQTVQRWGQTCGCCLDSYSKKTKQTKQSWTSDPADCLHDAFAPARGGRGGPQVDAERRRPGRFGEPAAPRSLCVRSISRAALLSLSGSCDHADGHAAPRGAGDARHARVGARRAVTTLRGRRARADVPLSATPAPLRPRSDVMTCPTQVRRPRPRPALPLQ